jgi:hypothetical protein
MSISLNSSKLMKQKQPIVCRRCKFYYITWDSRQPHGCKAMSFKSRRPPSFVVKKNSGQDCLQYSPKKNVPKSG